MLCSLAYMLAIHEEACLGTVNQWELLHAQVPRSTQEYTSVHSVSCGHALNLTMKMASVSTLPNVFILLVLAFDKNTKSQSAREVK
jgi:hypothetical protein